jgi:ZIP family zinc transporter
MLTLIAGAATGIGGALVLFRKKLSSNTLAGALGLSAGVMIFISLAELFPEAQTEIMAISSFRHGEALVLLAFFGGMGIITLIDFLVPEYENPHEASGLSLDAKTAAVGVVEQTGNEKALQRLGLMSALAIAIHNFPEGIATFIGALNDPQMGAGITFAIAIHNIPEGIAVAIPIYYATKSKGKALLYATLSGFSEVIGALLCLAVTAIFGVELTGGGPVFPLILAAVSGIMVYISLDELLPTAEKYGKHHIAIAGVIAGMAIMGVSLLIL